MRHAFHAVGQRHLRGHLGTSVAQQALLQSSRRGTSIMPEENESSRRVVYGDYYSQRLLNLPSAAFAPLVPLMKDPDIMVFCQGVPPPQMFPLGSLSAKLVDGTEVSLSPQDIVQAQRYAPFAWDPLKKWLQNHMQELHRPQILDWDIAVAAGSMSSVDLVCAAFVDPGDVVLTDKFTFTASLDALHSYGAQVVGVEGDSKGMKPESLDEICKGLRHEGGGRPAKFLYMVPVGSNPTGTTLCSQRYAQIYEIAQRHGLLIVEDDSYFYQQHISRPHEAAEGVASESNGLPGLQLGPSFLSLDVDGRVLRLDSFSKVLAPGFRIGWVTGPSELTAKYDALAYASSQNGSSLSIMLLGRMLEAWGRSGFEAQVIKLQQSLREKCAALMAAIEKHLQGKLEVWTKPNAGMFLWAKILAPAPSEEELVQLFKEHGVVALPGSTCTARTAGAQCPFIRISFSAEVDTYDEGMRRLSKVLDALQAQSAAAA